MEERGERVGRKEDGRREEMKGGGMEEGTREAFKGVKENPQSEVSSFTATTMHILVSRWRFRWPLCTCAVFTASGYCVQLITTSLTQEAYGQTHTHTHRQAD